MPSELSTGLAVHLAERLRALRQRYRKRLDRCREKFSETAVHELRIETRRLLALLDLLDALKADGNRAKLRRTVKKRLDWFDELRDTQVQLRLLKPMWADFPEALRLKKILTRAESRLVERLGRKVRKARLQRFNRRLKRLESDLRPQRGIVSGEAARNQSIDALQTAFRRVVLLRRRVTRADTETIHQLRVAFKRYRYMTELLRPVVPRLAALDPRRLKTYQDLAGNIQDLEVLLARVTRAAEGHELNPEAVARLQRELATRRQQAVGAFLKKINDLNDFQPPETERGMVWHSSREQAG